MERNLEKYAENGLKLIEKAPAMCLTPAEVMEVVYMKNDYDKVTKAYLIGVETGHRIAKREKKENG